MIRFILLAVIIVLIYKILRTLTQPKAISGRRPPRVNQAKTNAGQTMHQCAYCGIHVPQNETILQDGKSFCSIEHAKQWQHEQIS